MAQSLLESQSRLAGYLRGMRCSQVSIAGVDRLVIDFGTLTSTGSGEYAGAVHLLLECPWRVESAEYVVCGWEDTEKDIVQLASVLIDDTIVSTEVRRPGFDLTVGFSHGYTLTVFPDCRAYFLNEPGEEVLPWRIGGDGLPGGHGDLHPI